MRDPIKVPGDVQKVRVKPYILVKLFFLVAEMPCR